MEPCRNMSENLGNQREDHTPLRNEEGGLELELNLNGEVLDDAVVG